MYTSSHVAAGARQTILTRLTARAMFLKAARRPLMRRDATIEPFGYFVPILLYERLPRRHRGRATRFFDAGYLFRARTDAAARPARESFAHFSPARSFDEAAGREVAEQARLEYLKEMLIQEPLRALALAAEQHENKT